MCIVQITASKRKLIDYLTGDKVKTARIEKSEFAVHGKRQIYDHHLGFVYEAYFPGVE